MNKFKYFLIMFFLCSNLTTFGQTKVENSSEQPYIEVTGSAEKQVVPDEIYIGFALSEKYADKTKITIEQQEEKLKQSLKNIGIDLTNLFMTDLTSSFVKVYWQKKDVLTKKNYTLKVSDASTVGKVFEVFGQLEVTEARISKVAYSKIDSLRREIKIEAIKTAKEKANYLLSAIDEKLGKPLVINETSSEMLPSSNQLNVRGSYADTQIYYVDGVKSSDGELGFMKGNNEIQFQMIKVQTTIYIKYAIQ